MYVRAVRNGGKPEKKQIMIEKYRKYLIPTVVVVAVVAASLITYSLLKERQPDQIAEEPEPKLMLYGIEADDALSQSSRARYRPARQWERSSTDSESAHR